MMIEIKTPQFPESIADGEVATWHAKVGELVKRDQLLVDIETDKVVLEVAAPADGKLTAIHKAAGETVLAQELLGEFEAGAAGAAASAPAVPVTSEGMSEVMSEVMPAAAGTPTALASPAARKLANEHHLNLDEILGTGKGGRITRQDVLNVVAQMPDDAEIVVVAPQDAQHDDARLEKGTRMTTTDGEKRDGEKRDGEKREGEKRVPMSRLRASIAERLVQAQQTAAILTTFNEIDMQAIMAMRASYKDEFAQTHEGVKLGFMSFFIRACVEALQRFPAVNASIDGKDIVYHNYQDIGVAVGSPRGLVVPIIRDAGHKDFAALEAQVHAYGTKAREGKLSLAEITGGTFTLSNGGIFGSLLSTPILNPPQTAILGMHKIQERPVVVAGDIVIRPMMYVALSYDHRLIDGQEAVQFLVTVKRLLEEPARLLLNI